MQKKISKQYADKLKAAVRNGPNGKDEEELIDFFMEYWMENGEMPYGTQKARSGDPHNWTADQMEHYGDEALIDIIDDLTEQSKLKELFSASMIQEDSGWRKERMISNINKIQDQIERYVRVTKSDSVLAKSVKEFGADDKLLESINRQLSDVMDDIDDLIRSCYEPSEE